MVVGSLWPGRSKGEMKEELARGPHTWVTEGPD